MPNCNAYVIMEAVCEKYASQTGFARICPESLTYIRNLRGDWASVAIGTGYTAEEVASAYATLMADLRAMFGPT